MSALNAQLSSVEESVFGTSPVTTRFDEFVSEKIVATYGRVESNGMRAGRLYKTEDRFVPYCIGAAGDIVLEPGSKGFGFWLRQMLGGTPVTTGTATGYTHTIVPADLIGRSFTAQIGRPFYVGSSVQAFTYAGGKVASWTLANAVNGNLLATLSCDFISESTAVALAAASYPTALQNFSWIGGTVTIGGTQVDVFDASLTGDNGLVTDRRYLRGSAVKKEQVQDDYRAGTFALKADFDSTAQRDRVASATAAGAIATIVLRWEAPTVIPGGAIKPSLTATITARLDKFEANVSGPASLDQALSGVYLGSSALSIAYVTADATTLA